MFPLRSISWAPAITSAGACPKTKSWRKNGWNAPPSKITGMLSLLWACACSIRISPPTRKTGKRHTGFRRPQIREIFRQNASWESAIWTGTAFPPIWKKPWHCFRKPPLPETTKPSSSWEAAIISAPALNRIWKRPFSGWNALQSRTTPMPSLPWVPVIRMETA